MARSCGALKIKPVNGQPHPKRFASRLSLSGNGDSMRRELLIIMALNLFAAAPIIWFHYLPLIDYPDHLASLQIRNTLSSNHYLAQFYEFRWIFALILA